MRSLSSLPDPSADLSPGPAETLSAPTSTHDATRIFRLSPLIRLTLLAFYAALTLPLPVLAAVTQATVPPALLGLGLGLGAIALYGALSERVITDATGIQVTYPTWVRWAMRRGWSLAWADIEALKPRSTGQGGLVYYFLSKAGAAYLLPMRVAGFAELVRLVEAKTGIETRDVRPLSQPWMYLFLLLLTVLLLAVDIWTLTVALGSA